MIRPPVRSLAHRVDAALEIDGDLAVNEGLVAIRDRGECHNASVVDQHIHAAERGFRRVEQAADCRCIADIGLCRKRLSAGALNSVDQFLDTSADGYRTRGLRLHRAGGSAL
ncbi:hypothetical protein ACVJBD_003942 [Rhizobium mongolense]